MRDRLLFIIGKLDIGGAERHLLLVLPQLQKRGFQLSVYTLSSQGVLTPEFISAGIPVYTPPMADYFDMLPKLLGKPLLLLVSLFRLLSLLLVQRPKVVHFFLPEAYLVGGLVSLSIPGLRRVMSRRSLNNYQLRFPLLARMERWLHPHMDVILGNSQSVTQQLTMEGIAEDRLGLIYNGLDTSLFNVPFDKVTMRTELGLSSNGLVLILIANLIPYKGHDDLLNALAMIKDRLPEDWILLCVGRDNGIGDDLQSMARDLSIYSNVRWMGLRNDVTQLLRLSDIGLLVSFQEGFSNSILEGMAAGLPMIVTDVGGNSEAVLNGQTGYVVPPHQPEALAAAIAKLAVNRELITSMGDAGRTRAEEFFSLTDCVDRYENLYMGLLGKNFGTVSEMISGRDSKGTV